MRAKTGKRGQTEHSPIFEESFLWHQALDWCMARLARIVIPELAHHVTQRGNARRNVFFTPHDRQVYLGLLREYSSYYQLRILGYCLMTNHVHLVALPEQETALPRTMREVNGRYARYRNAIDRGSGHVWQNRYYCSAFEGIRLPSVMRYVELNPVRAGLVRAAEDYAWSSALIHLGGADGLGLLDTTAWWRDWTPEQWASWLSQGEQEGAAIRQATYSGRVLGSKEFVAGLEAATKRKLAIARPGRPRKETACAASS
jgi:putative transposase